MMKIIFKSLIMLFVCCFKLSASNAQELVVGTTTPAAIAVNAAVINGQMKTTNNNLSLISKGQLAVTGQLTIANTLQNDIYKGLSQVASIISNLYTIKDIAECGTDIVSDVEQALTYAQSDPVLLLFAEQGAGDFETRSIALGADVSAYVLRGGSGNLMDSGERGKLLNHIASELHILRGIAYGM